MSTDTDSSKDQFDVLQQWSNGNPSGLTFPSDYPDVQSNPLQVSGSVNCGLKSFIFCHELVVIVHLHDRHSSVMNEPLCSSM